MSGIRLRPPTGLLLPSTARHTTAAAAAAYPLLLVTNTGQQPTINWAHFLLTCTTSCPHFPPPPNLKENQLTKGRQVEYKSIIVVSLFSLTSFLDKQTKSQLNNLFFLAQHVSTVRPWSHGSINWMHCLLFDDVTVRENRKRLTI